MENLHFIGAENDKKTTTNENQLSSVDSASEMKGHFDQSIFESNEPDVEEPMAVIWLTLQRGLYKRKILAATYLNKNRNHQPWMQIV